MVKDVQFAALADEKSADSNDLARPRLARRAFSTGGMMSKSPLAAATLKRRHSFSVSPADDFSTYRAPQFDALHADYVPREPGGDDGQAPVPRLAALICVLAGVLAVWPATLINDFDPDAWQLVMLGNYVYMILFSILAEPALATGKREVSLATHGRLVAAAYAYYQGQNLAFRYGLPMPVVLVLKNGGLLSQIFVGAVLLRERYSWKQVAAAAIVTAGIVVALSDTIRGAGETSEDAYEPGEPPEAATSSPSSGAALGVAFLVGGMLLRSLGNEWTKRLFAAHGPVFNEALFYQHLLGLPLVLGSWQTLVGVAREWASVAPRMWFLLLAHLLGNYVCTQAATRVVASSTMALNLVLCVQRFLSIVLSATVLAKAGAPPPGASLWGGAVLVSAGIVAYAMAPPAAPPMPSLASHAVSDDLDDSVTSWDGEGV